MRYYEIIFLVHPDQSEQVPAMVERYRKMIEESGGEIHRHEDWGRKPLSYHIEKVHKAHFVLLNVSCDKATLDKLEKAFAHNDAVLRHLVLQREAAITEVSAMLRSEEERERMERRPASRMVEEQVVE